MSFEYGRPPTRIEGLLVLLIKVDSLPYPFTLADVRHLFEKYEEDVGDVCIPRDRWTRRESRGLAFARFHDRRDNAAEDSMESLSFRWTGTDDKSPHGSNSHRRLGSGDRDRRRRQNPPLADRRYGGGGRGERSRRSSDPAQDHLQLEKRIGMAQDQFRPRQKPS